MSVKINSVPSVSVTYARNGASTKANALGMRPMQERAYEKRGEQYLLIKSPPASGKSRALMSADGLSTFKARAYLYYCRCASARLSGASRSILGT